MLSQFIQKLKPFKRLKSFLIPRSPMLGMLRSVLAAALALLGTIPAGWVLVRFGGTSSADSQFLILVVVLSPVFIVLVNALLIGIASFIQNVFRLFSA